MTIDCAFSGCKLLTSVTIPSGVTSIGEYAFNNCSKLASVTMKKSVKTIGTCAFYGCSVLKDIYYDGGTADWDNIRKLGICGGSTPTITVHCTGGTVTQR